MVGGDVWIGHDLGRGPLPDPASSATRTSSTTSPRRAASAARTRWSSTPGAKHPIAAHLFINHLLDAQGQRLEHEHHRLHGPNAAAKQFIDAAILADPAVNPDKAILDKLEELLDLPNAVDEEYLTRWQALHGRRLIAAGRRPLGRSPGPDAEPARAARSSSCPRSPGWRSSSSSRWRSSWSSASGSRDELGRIVLDQPVARQLRAGRSTRSTCRRSSPRCATRADDDPSLAHRLPDRLLDLALRRAAQDPAAAPDDAAVLDELAHPDLRLDDHPARQRRRELAPPGRRPHERADHPAEHRLLGRSSG